MKLKNGKVAGKDKVTEWWTGFGGCVIWPFKIVLCWKTRDLL